MFKSGFVTIVGRPNVGKSTLTNKIMGEKLSIVSNKPQTTRNNIQTILTGEDYQIVFVDTPGIHKPKHKLGEYMVNSAKDSIKEVDLVLFLINPCDEIGKGDKFIIEALKAQKAPVFLVVNKVDENTHERVAKTLHMYSKEYDFNFLYPNSLSSKLLSLHSFLTLTHIFKLTLAFKSLSISYLAVSPIFFNTAPFLPIIIPLCDVFSHIKSTSI